MTEWLSTLEASGFATWLRESNTIWAYPLVLTLHTVGLGLLVGANWLLDLRVLGVWPRIPLVELVGSFRVMWIGFWINAEMSGGVVHGVGANWLLDLRVLGLWPRIPLVELVGSFRAMWIGFWINAEMSGGVVHVRGD